MDASYIAIADEDELKPVQMKRVAAGGKKLLLCNADRKHHVVDEMRSHEDYSLYLGCIQDGRIKCSLHGSFFDLETGELSVEPACDPIHTYPVKIADGKIWAASS